MLASIKSSTMSLDQRLRVAIQLFVDWAAWGLGLFLAGWARFEFTLGSLHVRPLILVFLLACLLQAFIGFALYVYRGRYTFGSFDEVRAVSLAALGTGAVLAIVDAFIPERVVPISTPLVGGVITLLLMLAVRYVRRAQRERMLRPRADALPVLVFGAGEAGVRLVRTMLRDPQSAYLPVGLIDDDPAKRHLRISGVPVVGDRTQLVQAAGDLEIAAVIIAIRGASSSLVREVQDSAKQVGAECKILPSISEVLDHRVELADVRDVQVTDLLGRHQVETDIASIAGYITGRRVLVTGAGGSIGSELCRQLHRLSPGELIMLDRDESALHAVQLSIHGRALLDGSDLVLADIRDGEHLRQIFTDRRPEVVFHAAALKHLSLLEQFPGEAVKSNIWGTQTVLEAAAAAGVAKFVNISTDKAADPTSVLGYSKRIAERLTAHVAQRAPGAFVSVRFGNVLGSRGSVLTAFAAQIEAGGPLTVTHPDVTRYFMTVPEAVQLVIQAAAIGGPGEALVLEMGEPVRISDVAKQMAAGSGRDVQIVYTGLRQGEKLHEDLFGTGEDGKRSLHPLISHVTVPPLDPDEALALDPTGTPGEVIDRLRELQHSNRTSLTR
ncbi:MAG: capD [Mycobacterium sp.]|nr:capD [Mycobacterium sp.]